MAINSGELSISNTSYVNKDFQTIYPEVLSIAQNISNRWNPDQTNESDPGIVLLKEASFIGDKNNYNIDKNVLECFMPSATQESSMRDLCARSGYSMGYYRAASTGITFMYTGSSLDSGGSFTLPAFTTQVTDADNLLVYTIVSPAILYKKNTPSASIDALQGTCSDLTVGDSKVITLSALDGDRRVYFPSSNVAENGIFVVNDSGGSESASWSSSKRWTRVDNMNVYSTGSEVYSFGYDSSKGLPYVEFPSNISSLMGSGLRIKYIVTSGADGNVTANYLTNLVSSVDVTTYDDSGASVSETLSSDNLVIGNLSSTSTGSDPETIDEAYSSFKRKVGTFDTLVTCRDYANYIYGMTSSSQPMVSNVQVSDRRTDLNYSDNIDTYDEYGEHTVSATSLSDITPYDLCLYPLSPINTSYTASSYINSFTPLESGSVNDVRTKLEDSMSLSHNFKSFGSGDIYALKNYYTLKARIATTYKVGASEQAEIVANVKSALYRGFNARVVDYGEEIPYDTILSAIEGADSRISSVSLDEPTVSPYVLEADGTEVEFTFDTDNTSSKDYFALVEAKNILSAKIPLYSYNEYFAFDFGMKNAKVSYTPKGGTAADRQMSVITSLKTMSTSLPIAASSLTLSAVDVSAGTGGYLLRKHEVIQLIHPSYTVSITYPYGVNYVYSGADIPANSIHELGSAETLKLNYTDSSSVVHTVTYGSGDVIKPNFTLTHSASASVTVGGVSYAQLGSSDEINLLTPVTYNLASSTPMYWSVTNSANRLFQLSERTAVSASLYKYTHLLRENEYLVYTNSAMTELVVLESGTRLTMYVPSTVTDDSVGTMCAISKSKSVKLSDVNTNGITAFSGIDWKYLGMTSDGLHVDEMTIQTFTEGTSVGAVAGTGTVPSLSNGFQDISGITLYYRNSDTDNTWTALSGFDVSGASWQARSRLDIGTSNSLTQTLLSGQSVTFADSSGNTYKVSGTSSDSYGLRMNTMVSKAGGSDIDLTVYSVTTDGLKESYGVQALVYEDESIYGEDSSGSKTVMSLPKSDSAYSLDVKSDLTDKGLVALHLPFLQTPIDSGDSSTSGNRQMVMLCYVTSSAAIAGTVSVKAYASGAAVSGALRNPMVTPDAKVWLDSVTLAKGMQYVEVRESKTVDEIVVEFPGTGMSALSGDVLLFSAPSQITGYNPALALTDSDRLKRLHAKMALLDSGKLFMLTNRPDSAGEIDVGSLDSADALWDANNVANRFTIPEIDFDDTSIAIVKTSRLN